MRKSLFAKVLEIILYLLLLFTVIFTILAPLFLSRFSGIIYSPDLWSNKIFLLQFFLVFMGLVGVWVIAELIGMVRTIPDNPFVKRNVGALKRTGVAALVGAILFFAKCIFIYSFPTLVCGIALIIAMLFCFTLSDLFAQAVQYKQENDFTI